VLFKRTFVVVAVVLVLVVVVGCASRSAAKMTNYNKWDSAARDLCKEADEEAEREKAACDEALGLKDGPKGPPTAKAEAEMKNLEDHSGKRSEFIAWSKDREITLSHTASDEPVMLGADVEGKAVRLSGSKGVTYVLPADIQVLKLMADSCCDVKIHVQSKILTSTVELYKCQQLDLELDEPVGTLQVDECLTDVRVQFAERDHVGRIYHQNSPGLTVRWSGCGEPHTVGLAKNSQWCTRILGDGTLETFPVRRGEGEFPVDLPSGASEIPAGEQPEPEAMPAADERTQQAEKQRLAGNDMFRASDFAQAAALYSLALELDPEQGAVWANRSACWMKLGDHEKALADATRCSEVEPMNPKGWFRKGMSLHAMKRFSEAIPALLEAEKLEPSNKQVIDAIKMAQMMARRGD